MTGVILLRGLFYPTTTASTARTRLTLDEVLSGVFDDDFRLFDSESSKEEGEYVYAYSGKGNIYHVEVVVCIEII